MNADEIAEVLGLQPHPEGGMYVGDVARAGRAVTPDARATGTAIYFLLRAGERSHWHRVDATEIWHHYAGDALQLQIEHRRPVRHVPRARLGPRRRPTPASDRAARCLAGRAFPRCVDARGLHRLARFRVRRIRAGADALGTVGRLI